MGKYKKDLIAVTLFFIVANIIGFSHILPELVSLILFCFGFALFFGYVLYDALIKEKIKDKIIKNVLQESIAEHDIVLVESILTMQTRRTKEYELVPSKMDIFMKDKKLIVKTRASVNGFMKIKISDDLSSWEIEAVHKKEGYSILFKNSKGKIIGKREPNEINLRNREYVLVKEENQEIIKTGEDIFSIRTFYKKADRLSFIDFPEKVSFEKQLDSIMISISNYFYNEYSDWVTIYDFRKKKFFP